MAHATSARLAVYSPEPADITSYTNDCGGIALHIHPDAWIVAGDSRFGDVDVATQAAALRKLADLAGKAAAILEARAGAAAPDEAPRPRLAARPYELEGRGTTAPGTGVTP